MELKSKLDHFFVGFIPGILVPVITLLIVFSHSFINLTVQEFFYFLKTMNIMTKLLSLCVLPNLLVFFIFIWPDYLKSARGVLAATFIVAFVILGIQFFFS
jgi:hypothetical protein